MRIIATINQKGGVGKTTSVTNLGAALANAGQRVLLIDLDPQTHLTLSYNVEPTSERPSVYDVLTNRTPLVDVVRKVRDNIWMISSHINLAAAELELVSVVGREVILRDALATMDQEYDYVFIDCAPSLGLLTLNALTAATEVFIPLQPHFLALQGVGKLFETVALVRDRLNPALSVTGVLLCMYESGTRLAAEVVEDLRQFLDGARGTEVPWANARIFDTVIRRNIKLAECPSHGQTIFDYEPRSNGARDYARLAEEVLGANELSANDEPVEEASSASQTPPVAAENESDEPAVEPQVTESRTSGVSANLA
ncbi:MAG: ParA family protein [bacterium]|nr:ParA family protein [bacterium]